MPTVPGTLVGMGIATLCGTASFVSRQPLFQLSVPTAFGGRVFGTSLSMMALSSLIGMSVGSVLATGVGIRGTMAIGGAIQSMAAILLLLWLRGSPGIVKSPSREVAFATGSPSREQRA